MTSLGRLWRTVRWLKAEQALGRARLLTTARLLPTKPDARPAPPVRHSLGARWVAPPPREPSLVGPTRLRLLNEEHDLGEVGWDDPALPLLWRYNQHYFDDLNAVGADTRGTWHVALVDRWLGDNPPGRGTAWAPYPTSLRIVNWIKWFVGGQAASEPWLRSLAMQTRWLERHIEWHLLGNHLFVNAKALLFAGLFFEGREAERWLDAGLAILERELGEQILPDGAQFELSPMYHALALEDVLDLLNLIGARIPATPTLPAPTAASRALGLVPRLRQLARAMLHWLRCLRHPGGALARFNDCAAGIAPTTDDIERYAAQLGSAAPTPQAQGVLALQPSGYVRAARGAAVALLDVARVGPDYLPGHAHADTLSFELSVHGQELIVNRGTSVYGDGPRRQLERGTAAHSTVQVGAHDSSEVWAGFRVGRRARPRQVEMAGFDIRAAHDGYAHLPGHPLHHRAWHMEADTLRVDDRVSPAPAEPCTARFHLAPGLDCAAQADGSWLVARGPQVMARARVEKGSARLEHWQHAECFGRLVPALTLAVQLEGGAAAVRWTWPAAAGKPPP